MGFLMRIDGDFIEVEQLTKQFNWFPRWNYILKLSLKQRAEKYFKLLLDQADEQLTLNAEFHLKNLISYYTNTYPKDKGGTHTANKFVQLIMDNIFAQMQQNQQPHFEDVED